MSATYRLSTLAALAILATAGCSGNKHPATAAVSGTVTYQGAPVEGATVAFASVAGDSAATAITDASGKYVLNSWSEGDGAVPGQYQVTISKIVSRDQNQGKTPEQISEELAAKYARGETPPEPVLTYLVPKKYASPGSSQLTANVKAGEANVFDFTLTD